MNIHNNARLTPIGRERIVMQVASGLTPQAAARAAGVCPRTIRKWVARYAVEGVAGWQDRSSRPKRLHRPTPQAVIARIGELRLQRLTGNSGVGGNRAAAIRTSGTGTGAGVTTGNGGAPGGAGGGNGGGPGGVGENGPTGVFRLLDSQLGAQIGWLLALALIGVIATAWQTRRRWPLSDQQSAVVLWTTWLLTTAAFFSVAGFFHTYYLVMMAPAVSALAGIAVALHFLGAAHFLGEGLALLQLFEFRLPAHAKNPNRLDMTAP